jgi:DNA invertase Pin-like site-specific DNA recombinase
MKTEINDKKLVVGYSRVSTFMQADSGSSIKTQEQRIRDWAEDNLEEIDYIFSDKGESGTKADRTEYSLLKEEIQKGRIKTVYVFSISRLGRNLPEVVSFVELCNKTKTKLIAIADSFDSTNPTSYLSFYILTAIADHQSKETSLRIKSTFDRKKKNKEKYSRNIPIGLKEDPKQKGILVEAEEDKKIIQRIKNLKSRGYSLQKIADRLNDNNIKTKTGKEWSRHLVLHYMKKSVGTTSSKSAA